MMENYYGVFTNQSAVKGLAEIQQRTVYESSIKAKATSSSNDLIERILKSQNVKEQGMGVHYSANMLEARSTQDYLGFVQGAGHEYYADEKLQWGEYDSVCIDGIVDKASSLVVDSSDYFDTFFE